VRVDLQNYGTPDPKRMYAFVLMVIQKNWKIGYLPKSLLALDHLPKVDCVLVKTPLET
jgi:hypothetical protein